jgi:hypothetical protein
VFRLRPWVALRSTHGYSQVTAVAETEDRCDAALALALSRWARGLHGFSRQIAKFNMLAKLTQAR